MTPLEPTESPGFLLWRVTLQWQREIAAALGPLALTHVQFVLLASVWWLNEQGRQPSQVAVAEHAGVDVKMASQVLRKLEAAGLIDRRLDRADSRARTLHATAAGARLAVEAIAVVEAADARFFGRLPSADAQALTRALGVLGRPR